MADVFACPPDCGWCCTHLTREASPEESRAEREFRDVMREHGVYSCADAPRTGLSLAPAEAASLVAESRRRGLGARIHPRTWMLESRRRLAVVLDWHMPHEVCPFYADYACTAYDLRPLPCRAFPVLGGAPAWSLSPHCPKVETLTPNVRLGSFLRAENVARRAIERRHADLDARAAAWENLPGVRLAKGLARAEAARRLKRYRVVSPEEFEARCTARAKS